MDLRIWARAEGRLMGAVLRAAGNPAVHIELDRGGQTHPPPISAPYTLRAAGWPVLARLLADPEWGFGHEFARGRLTVDGDLAGFCREIYRTSHQASGPGILRRLLSAWLLLTQPGTRGGARSNVHRHYDLPADFYRLWLDRDLIYTCAWFPHPRATLEDAQTAKLERVCRKLTLEPGERVLEAGCGWGALALYMARHCGVHVRAFNLSRQQVEYARRRAAREGLSSAVEFIEDDYRNVRGRFDAFVSIGMLEHVGARRYAELGRLLEQWLGATGRGLLHFIGRSRRDALSPWIRSRIFPGAYVPTLGEALPLLEQGDYAVTDVENLRRHYARTLACWRERFEANWSDAAQMFDQEFLRAWRLYLAGSQAAFETGNLQLYQVLFAGRACRSRLWTREWAGDAQHEPAWSR